MGTRYLLDSNIIIYLSKGILTAENSSIIASIEEYPSNISVITQIEVLGWNPPTLQEAEKLQRLVDNATVYALTDEIVQKTIEIKKAQRLKLPDAVIAATALVHGFQLITRNTGDFFNLPGLQIVNPFER
jgi:predicted nucleic acid-binding protein